MRMTASRQNDYLNRLLVAGLVFGCLVIGTGLFFPKLNKLFGDKFWCRQVEMDFATARVRSTRYLCYLRVGRRVENTWLTPYLAPGQTGENRRGRWETITVQDISGNYKDGSRMSAKAFSVLRMYGEVLSSDAFEDQSLKEKQSREFAEAFAKHDIAAMEQLLNQTTNFLKTTER